MKPQNIVAADYPALKRAHTKALKLGTDKFEFRGNTYYTVYAKYVLEYLKPLYRKMY